MSHIEDFDFASRKALVRVDFNVPLKEGKVTDDTRIRAAIPTIKKVLSDGGACILMSHLGRPKAQEPQFSLKQVVSTLSSLLGQDVKFSRDCVGPEAVSAAAGLKAGEVLLFGITRKKRQETKVLQSSWRHWVMSM